LGTNGIGFLDSQRHGSRACPLERTRRGLSCRTLFLTRRIGLSRTAYAARSAFSMSAIAIIMVLGSADDSWNPACW